MSIHSAGQADSNMTAAQQKDFRDNIGAGSGALLETITASALAQVEFTGLDPSKSYLIKCEGVYGSGSGVLQATVSSDTGASDYLYNGLLVTSSVSNDDNSSSAFMKLGNVSDSSVSTAFFNIDINGIDSSVYTVVTCRGSYFLSPSAIYKTDYTASRVNAQEDTSIQISVPSQTLNGVFKLYAFD